MNKWDNLAKNYDTILMQKYSLKPTRKKVLEIIKQTNFKSILDIGCGTGQLIEEVLESYQQVEAIGIDSSLEMINCCNKKKLTAQFLHSDVEIIYEVFKGRTFDVITCCHSFPYYKNQSKALSDMLELLSDEGILILFFGSVNNIYDKVMFKIIEKTASKANYISIADFRNFKQPITAEYIIKEKIFSPTIAGFTLRRR